MRNDHIHDSHPKVLKRLKRASGHLRHVIEMIETEESCLKISLQLQAVEKAILVAKRALIHDHIDHCLTLGSETDVTELRAIAKLL